MALAQSDSSSDGDASLDDRDAGSPVEVEARQQFDYCQSRWAQRDVAAWDCFVRIDRESKSGQIARDLLEQSNDEFIIGLEKLHEGRDQDAREYFRKGMDIGPFDPHHYFELAEIYYGRDLYAQAIRYCGTYLDFMNKRRETVDRYAWEKCIEIITRPTGGPSNPEPRAPEPRETPWTVSVAIGLGLVAVFAIFFLFYYRSGKTLKELIHESPDLHPRIAYALSCLRHELLKHRLGALGDVVCALQSREGLTEKQLKYLRDRLYGGESLSGLWRIYVEIFDRIAGRRLHLDRRDREFRRAWLAVRSLENLRDRLAEPDEQLAGRLDSLRQQIDGFDRHLKWLSDRLCRTAVDGKLLREAVFSVQSEPRAAAVQVDEIRFSQPPDDIFVEVFRSDLLIILRNLVRNAIFALGEQDENRRVLSLEVELRPEPTGDESVLIKVFDTSPEVMTTEDIYGRRFDRGLGLVAAAVTRYDGSVFVENGRGEFKAVVVRFFRAFGEGA